MLDENNPKSLDDIARDSFSDYPALQAKLLSEHIMHLTSKIKVNMAEAAYVGTIGIVTTTLSVLKSSDLAEQGKYGTALILSCAAAGAIYACGKCIDYSLQLVRKYRQDRKSAQEKMLSECIRNIRYR